MEFLKKHKTKLIVLVVIVIAFWLFSVFSGNSSEDPILQGNINEEQLLSESENNDLIALLSELKGIRLDDGLFSDEVFRRLVDYSVTISPLPIGRPNPFAPVQ